MDAGAARAPRLAPAILCVLPPPAADAVQPPANWTREQPVHMSTTLGIMRSSGRRDSGRNECLAPAPKDVCSEHKKNLVEAAGVDLQLAGSGTEQLAFHRAGRHFVAITQYGIV